MALINKEAQVCNLLNEYVEKKVKELMEKCDSNWLLHDKKTFAIPKNNLEKERSIHFIDTEIKNILFDDNEIYYTPKYLKQKSVKQIIKLINEESERILKQYNKYESLIDSNIEVLNVLLKL